MVGALHTVSLILTKTLQWRHYNHFTFYRWINQSFGSLNDLPKVTILVTGRAKFESSSVSTQSPNENPHSSHTNIAKHTHYPWAFQSQNWIHRYYSEHCLLQVLTFLFLYTFYRWKEASLPACFITAHWVWSPDSGKSTRSQYYKCWTMIITWPSVWFGASLQLILWQTFLIYKWHLQHPLDVCSCIYDSDSMPNTSHNCPPRSHN